MDAQGNVQAFRRIDPVGPAKSDYMFINPLALDPNDANVLYLPAGRKFYRQNQLGSIALTGEWDTLAQGWVQFPDTLTAGEFSAVSVSQTSPQNRVYLGTSNNKLFRIDNAHQGTPSFTTLTSPLTNNAANVNCIAVDPRNADRIVVVYSNYNIYSLYLSEDGGTTWKKVGGNLEAAVGGSGNAPSIRWVNILPQPNGKTKYFCGTSVGLYSADTLLLHATGQPGTQWVQEGPDAIGSTVVSYVESRPSDGLVVAATHGNGMFTASFSPASAAGEPTASNKVRVTPNPATDFIRLDLDETWKGDVVFSLYDLKGTLIRQKQFRGTQASLDLQELSKGVYLWSVQAAGRKDSGKIVLQ
jgi:hypothetical protein